MNNCVKSSETFKKNEEIKIKVQFYIMNIGWNKGCSSGFSLPSLTFHRKILGSLYFYLFLVPTGGS